MGDTSCKELGEGYNCDVIDLVVVMPHGLLNRVLGVRA